MIEQFSRQPQLRRRDAGTQVDGSDLCLADIFAGSQGGDDAIDLPDVMQFRSPLADSIIQPGFQRMLGRQGVHPGREEQVQLLHGEFVEDRFHNVRYGGLVQLQTVDGYAVHLVPGSDVLGDSLSTVSGGVHGVQQYDEGFSQFLQFPDDPFLRFQVVLPRNVGHGAVSGDDDADGRMFCDDLSGADLRRFGHGDLVVEPRRRNHTRRVVLILADGSLYHIPHTVDEPDGKSRAALQLDLGGFLRDEFWLCRHNGPARTALWKFVTGPLPAVDVVNIGDHLGLHEPLDESGFSGPHRAHHADVDISRGTGGDILIDTGIHSNLHAPDGACSDLAAPRMEAAFSGHRLDLLYVPRWQSMTARLSLAKCTKANGFFLRDSFLFRLYSDNLAW